MAPFRECKQTVRAGLTVGLLASGTPKDRVGMANAKNNVLLTLDIDPFWHALRACHTESLREEKEVKLPHRKPRHQTKSPGVASVRITQNLFVHNIRFAVFS